jgi:predicted DNA-binding transcriptional regulator AlpA
MTPDRVVKAIQEAPREALPMILATVLARMMEPEKYSEGRSISAEDTLLTPAQAAQRLSLSMRQLYRRAETFPFVRRLGAKTLRFSSRGLEAYLRNGGQ